MIRSAQIIPVNDGFGVVIITDDTDESTYGFETDTLDEAFDVIRDEVEREGVVRPKATVVPFK